jgi:uncharacterized membrane protein YfcA
MIAGLPSSEIAWLVLALIAAGLVTGFLSGLLGIGGGGIIVPVLYEVFQLSGVSDSIRMQACVATSLAIIIPTSIRSARSHWGHGAVDFSVIRSLGPWVVLGALLGVLIASRVSASVLEGVFVAATLFMAYRIAFGNGAAIADRKLPGLPLDALAGAGVGLLSTLIGIGGGAYITAYMKLYGWPIHTAVGTGSGFAPLIAVPAITGYIIAGWNNHAGVPLALGFVSLAGAIVIAPITVLAAPLGVKVAHRLSRRHLEYAFIAFFLAVAARFSAGLIFGR